MRSPNNGYTFEDLDLSNNTSSSSRSTSRSSSRRLISSSSKSSSPNSRDDSIEMGGSPKRFTESTDLSGEDYTESSTDDFGEDNLYDLVDVPIKKYDAGCSLPSTYSIRDFIEFRRENRRRSLVWISVVCMLMIVIMGLSIGLAKRSTDRDGAVSSSSSETTTTTTTRPTLFQIKKFLVEQGVVDSMYVLENDKQGQMPHPQHQAAVWLAKHDEAALPLPQESDPDYEHESYRYATRFVMALNYYALGGEDWNNGLKFLSAGDICSWYLVVNDVDAEGNAYQIPKGLWCDDNGIPTALTIPHNGLTGELPSENGFLTTLTELDFSRNGIEGQFPENFCKLQRLQDLHLDRNAMEGEIPSCIGEMTGLHLLSLGFNDFEGALPQEITNLKNLHQLFLQANEFQGPVQGIFTELTQLRSLDVSDNHFSDKLLPSLIESLKFIEVLNLSYNKFKGGYDFFLESKSLHTLNLSNNLLRGNFPQQLSRNKKLRVLDLQNNAFLAGPLHESIGNLTALTHLYLSDNAFAGVLPSALGTLNHLERLFMANLSRLQQGPAPDLSKLTNLQELSLKNSKRIGPLPLFAENTNLQFLDLALNVLSGPIPDEWAAMKDLRVLILSANPTLAGAVPVSFQDLKSLELFLVDGTQLSGNIEFMCSSMNLVAFGETSITLECGAGQFEDCSCCLCCQVGFCSEGFLENFDSNWESYSSN